MEQDKEGRDSGIWAKIEKGERDIWVSGGGAF